MKAHPIFGWCVGAQVLSLPNITPLSPLTAQPGKDGIAEHPCRRLELVSHEGTSAPRTLVAQCGERPLGPMSPRPGPVPNTQHGCKRGQEALQPAPARHSALLAHPPIPSPSPTLPLSGFQIPISRERVGCTLSSLSPSSKISFGGSFCTMQ